MRNIRAVQIHETTTDLTLCVAIFPTLRSLNHFYRRSGGWYRSRCRACYVSYGNLDVRTGGAYGCIAFAADDLGAGVVAHEVFHAVHDLYKRLYPSARYRDRNDIEERMATEIGGLVKSFWDWWYSNCPKRYRLEFTDGGKVHRFIPVNDAPKP